MLASTGSGRQLNRFGPGPLLVAGFGFLALGYGASALAGGPLWVFLAATMPVGLGVGVVVGGALRSVAIDEAPPSQRGAAQGLINVFTSVGTLLAAAVVSAVADLAGGGADGFGRAYLGVAACMLLLAWAAQGLGRKAPAAPSVGP